MLYFVHIYQLLLIMNNYYYLSLHVLLKIFINKMFLHQYVIYHENTYDHHMTLLWILTESEI